MLYKEITVLAQEEQSVKKFRTANKSDISKFDDVCAICLGEMKSARETQCHHLFHDHCLSLAIKTSNFCPFGGHLQDSTWALFAPFFGSFCPAKCQIFMTMRLFTTFR